MEYIGWRVEGVNFVDR